MDFLKSTKGGDPLGRQGVEVRESVRHYPHNPPPPPPPPAPPLIRPCPPPSELLFIGAKGDL